MHPTEQPRNLWTLVEPSLKKHGDLPAWICRGRKQNRVVSYNEIYDASLTLAARLRESGVEPGNTVGITAPNSPEWNVAALAVWKLGANIAPIHIGNSEHDIQAQVDAVNPHIMLVHETKQQFANSRPIDMEIDSNLATAEAAQAVPENAGETAVRIYTSGSTGSPKIVRLSHANHASNVLSAAKLKEFDSNDRFISLLPFSHAMGLTANLLLPLYAGSAIVTPKVLAASEIIATLEQERISVLIAVPRLFRNIMLGLEKKFAAGGPALKAYLWLIRHTPMFLRQHINAPVRKKLGGRIKCWVSGGSHLDGRICHYFHKLGIPLRQGYGLTETSPLACVQAEYDTAVESVGKPIEGVEVRLDNADAEGKGEVLIRGPNVMLGYEDEEQNAAAFDGEWFKTGDIAKIDEAGRVTLTGRSKRLIVTEAGKNVYPEELETLLERNPVIKEAGVFELDMKPACLLAVDAEYTEDDVRNALKSFNELVSGHNQITRFAITEELPRTPLGKIALQQLPAIFAEKEHQG